MCQEKIWFQGWIEMWRDSRVLQESNAFSYQAITFTLLDFLPV